MMNVLLYTDCDFFSGSESMIANFLNSKEFANDYKLFLYYRSSSEYRKGLAKRLENLNRCHSSRVISIRRSQLPLSVRNNIIIRLSWRLINILTAPGVYFYNIIVLFNLLRKSSREIIIINNGGYPGATSCLQAAILAKLLGFTKVIMVVNNTAQSTVKIFRWLFNYFDQLVFQSIDTVVTGSQATKEALIKFKSVKQLRIVTIPNGIDEKRFDSNDITLRRNKKFVVGQVVNLCIIGLHEDRKGHLILLKSIYRLFIKYSNLSSRLTVSVEGEGPLTGSLKSYCKEVGISNIVKFLGNVDNISKLYSSMDILIVPSLYSEDLPNVISEAMLFGIPTVGSKIAGIPSQIIDGENGFLVEPGDINGLSKTIENVLGNTELLSSMSIKCIDRFYQNYNKDIAITRYINLIKGEL